MRGCLTHGHRHPNSLLVYVTVPDGTRGRQVQVTITSKSLKVLALGKQMLAGDLFAPVVADECTWEMADGKVLITNELRITNFITIKKRFHK